jgi:hypothetical protein
VTGLDRFVVGIRFRRRVTSLFRQRTAYRSLALDSDEPAEYLAHVFAVAAGGGVEQFTDRPSDTARRVVRVFGQQDEGGAVEDLDVPVRVRGEWLRPPCG